VAGAERSRDAGPQSTPVETVTLMRYVPYQSVLCGIRRSGLHELLVQTDNSGRHLLFFISLSTVQVYSGVALSPFDMHYHSQTFIKSFFF